MLVGKLADQNNSTANVFGIQFSLKGIQAEISVCWRSMNQLVNRSMLLTQVRQVNATGADDLVGGAASGADLTVYYRDLENPGAHALAQYFERHADRVLSLGNVAALPNSVNGIVPTRYACREVSDSGPYTIRSDEWAPILMIVAFDVPPDYVAEVERWYSEEHIPLLMRAPGWMRARRYHVEHCQGGRRFTSIALHELRDRAVLDSEERAFARATAWRTHLAAQPWFEAAGRFVYERVLV